MGRTAAAVAAAAVLAVATGCTSDSPTAATPTAATPTDRPGPTYLEPPRTARPFETPLATARATGQNVSVTVLGVRTHLSSLIGTHAEWLPRGEYERLRIALDNGSSTYREFATERLLLVTTDGTTYQPDYDAMNIARQPTVATVPAQGRLEMDLWFDVRRGSGLRALRVQDLSADVALPS